MIQHSIKFAQDMDPAIHGVNKQTKNFSLSNYSLTTQIVIINLSTAVFALASLFFFNLKVGKLSNYSFGRFSDASIITFINMPMNVISIKHLISKLYF